MRQVRMEGSVVQATLAAVAVSAAVTGTRIAWFCSVPYLVRVLDRRPRQRDRRITGLQRLPLAWAGMRGGISLVVLGQVAIGSGMSRWQVGQAPVQTARSDCS
ncbi:hypothetical protein ACFW5D_27510, partial [Streptomyces sp. NPDC058770]